jgi:hypothetical protein
MQICERIVAAPEVIAIVPEQQDRNQPEIDFEPEEPEV